MKGLGINKAAGILDIIASVMYFLAIFIIVGAAVNDVVSNGDVELTGAQVFGYVMLGFAAVCVVLHIVGLVQSKKAGMKLTGNILGIIGHAIYFLFGAAFGWVAMILTILSAVFTLKDNKMPTHHSTAKE